MPDDALRQAIEQALNDAPDEYLDVKATAAAVMVPVAEALDRQRALEAAIENLAEFAREATYELNHLGEVGSRTGLAYRDVARKLSALLPAPQTAGASDG